MVDTSYVEVTVKEAAHEDAGRGIARLSIDMMKTLNLVSGDVIEIEGRAKAATLVWPGFPQDTGKAILRIDGSTRGNVQAGIDDKVRIRKSEAGYAKKITIQPTQAIRLVGGEQDLGRLLRGRPVAEGQAIRVNILGNALMFVIAKVAPKGIVIVTDSTEIELKETPYEPKKGREATGVHYEDIGGLGRELELVREMIRAAASPPRTLRAARHRTPEGRAALRPAGHRKDADSKSGRKRGRCPLHHALGP